jgi:hypothetical protein
VATFFSSASARPSVSAAACMRTSIEAGKRVVADARGRGRELGELGAESDERLLLRHVLAPAAAPL